MSKPVGVGAVGVSDLPVLQLEALNVDYDGAVFDMSALESLLDSDDDGSFDDLCVVCDGETDDECEECGDPLCQVCGYVCAYCFG